MKTRGALQRMLTVCLILALLCLTGCRPGQEAIYSKYAGPSGEPETQSRADGPSQSVPPEAGARAGKKDLAGELTISDISQIPGYGTDGIVSAFEEAYPQVKITVDYAIPAGQQRTSEAVSGYFQRLATELMSGESADVIAYWDGMISAKDIARNGYAVNLYDWMDADPEFRREDYFENIFGAYEFQGGLYQMPVLFASSVLVLNSRITDALGYTFQPWEEIRYETVVSIYREAEERGLLAPGFTIEFEDLTNPGDLFREAVFPDFFDEDGGSASFDSPAFIEYLESTRALPSQRLLAEGSGMVGGGTALQEFAQSNAGANTSLTFSTALTMADFPNLAGEIAGNTPPLLLTSQGGACPFASAIQYMVSSSCKDPELAWEFLKFAAGRVEQPGYYTVLEGGTDFTHGNMPVEKENFRAFSKLYAQVDELSRSDPEGWMNGFDRETAHCPLDGGFLDRAEQAVERFNSGAALPSALSGEFQPILIQYYDTDTLTAQECAAQLQEKAELFLAE